MTSAAKGAVSRHRRRQQRTGTRMRAWLRRPRGEEGFADFVIVLPVFFLLVVAGIQFALWSHAAHLARAAAEQGSQVASGYGSSQSAGTQAAYQFIDTTGPGTLTNAQVSATTLAGGVAQVTVTGRAQALIPWFDLTVSATSSAPIQEYRPGG
jgi:Flp pilus assembly protein TadG